MTSSWFFLSTLNYDARSTTHQIYDIKGYYRYFDDILTVHTDNTTNIHTVPHEFNSITPKLQFTLEKEQNDKINFLDFTVVKTQKGLTFDIYRKPTTTDIIIPQGLMPPF